MDEAPRAVGKHLARRADRSPRDEGPASSSAGSQRELRDSVDELQASRARVVAAADAERRGIERELHDGAQQHLVALAVKLQLAQQLAGLRSDRRHGGAGGAHARRARCARERETARRADLPAASSRSRPRGSPSGGGLWGRDPDAGRGAVRPVRAGGRGDGIFLLSRGPENAAEHAGAGARATIRVRTVETTLVFEVIDDGNGFDESASPWGSGLCSIGDRLGAIGGRLTLSSEPGHGTRVSGAIPLAP